MDRYRQARLDRKNGPRPQSRVARGLNALMNAMFFCIWNYPSVNEDAYEVSLSSVQEPKPETVIDKTSVNYDGIFFNQTNHEPRDSSNNKGVVEGKKSFRWPWSKPKKDGKKKINIEVLPETFVHLDGFGGQGQAVKDCVQPSQSDRTLLSGSSFSEASTSIVPQLWYTVLEETIHNVFEVKRVPIYNSDKEVVVPEEAVLDAYGDKHESADNSEKEIVLHEETIPDVYALIKRTLNVVVPKPPSSIANASELKKSSSAPQLSDKTTTPSDATGSVPEHKSRSLHRLHTEWLPEDHENVEVWLGLKEKKSKESAKVKMDETGEVDSGIASGNPSEMTQG